MQPLMEKACGSFGLPKYAYLFSPIVQFSIPQYTLPKTIIGFKVPIVPLPIRQSKSSKIFETDFPMLVLSHQARRSLSLPITDNASLNHSRNNNVCGCPQTQSSHSCAQEELMMSSKLEKATQDWSHEIKGRLQDARLQQHASTITMLNETLNAWAVNIMALFVLAITILRPKDNMGKWGIVGSMLNYWLSKLLKDVIKQPRPTSAMVDLDDAGMPSSHAQSLFYFTTYGLLGGFGVYSLNVRTISIMTLSVLFAVYLTCLRVSEGQHTLPQVTVGGSLGVIVAILWTQLGHFIGLKPSNVMSSGGLSIFSIAGGCVILWLYKIYREFKGHNILTKE